MLVEIGEERLQDRSKEERKSSNQVSSFLEMLTKCLISSTTKERLQQKYAQILENSEEIAYEVLSQTRGEETLLTFEKDGIKCIKVPNEILPEGTNSRTVLNYKKGTFEVEKEQTQTKNEQWKQAQEKEEILKENRKYTVTWLANDFTEVVAEDDKKTYRFDFMQDYIPLNLKEQLQEGDTVIVRDGRLEKLGAKGFHHKAEDTYWGEVKEYIGRAEQIYMVTDVQSRVIKIQDLAEGKEQFVKKENGELKRGDFIKTKSKGYEKYDGIVPIKNKKMLSELKKLYDNIF